MATRLDLALRALADARKAVSALQNNLAVVRYELAPLRKAVRQFNDLLWAQCWTVENVFNETTSDPEMARRWREEGIVRGLFWNVIDAAAYAGKDATLAQFRVDIEPHLRAERALKAELEIAERDLASAKRLVKRCKGDSTGGSNQHAFEWD